MTCQASIVITVSAIVCVFVCFYLIEQVQFLQLLADVDLLYFHRGQPQHQELHALQLKTCVKSVIVVFSNQRVSFPAEGKLPFAGKHSLGTQYPF